MRAVGVYDQIKKAFQDIQDRRHGSRAADRDRHPRAPRRSRSPPRLL